MIEWLPMDVEAGHGCRAVLRVQRAAWGAGGGDGLRVFTATRVSHAHEKPFWHGNSYAAPDFQDDDPSLTGWMPETTLIGLKCS